MKNNSPLAGLTLKEMQLLLHQHEVRLSDELTAVLYSLTQGNPQLLTLAINMLSSGGNLDALIKQMTSTVDVEQYILHEIDEAISSEERGVMKAISVLGEYPASRECIETIADNVNLTGLLNSLLVRNLITSSGTNGSTRYSQHSMVQRFYYQTLSRAEQTKLHKRAGLFYQEGEVDLIQAASHYEQAAEYAESIGLLTGESGLTLIRSGQAQAVIQLLTKLSDEHQVAVEQPTLRLPIALSKAAAYRTSGTYIDALDLLEALATDNYSEKEYAQIAYELGLIYSRLSRFADALEQFKKVLATPEGLKDSKSLARLHDSIGWAYRGVGQHELARTHFEVGHEEAIRAEDIYTVCDTDLGIGLLEWQFGSLEEAEKRFVGSRERLMQAGYLWAEANSLNNLALVYCQKKQFDEAIDCFDEAADLFERVGKIDGLIIVYNNLGELCYITEEYLQAIENLKKAVELAEQTQNLLQVCIGHSALAKSLFALKKLADAELHIAEAQQIAEGNLYQIELGVCYRIQGEIALQRNEPNNAVDFFTRSIPLLELDQDVSEVELAKQGLNKAFSNA